MERPSYEQVARAIAMAKTEADREHAVELMRAYSAVEPNRESVGDRLRILRRALQDSVGKAP